MGAMAAEAGKVTSAQVAGSVVVPAPTPEPIDTGATTFGQSGRGRQPLQTGLTKTNRELMAEAVSGHQPQRKLVTPLELREETLDAEETAQHWASLALSLEKMRSHH